MFYIIAAFIFASGVKSGLIISGLARKRADRDIRQMNEKEFEDCRRRERFSRFIRENSFR